MTRSIVSGIFAVLAVTVFYIWLSAKAPTPPQAPLSVSAGWDDLLPCSETKSLDGTAELILEEDGSAKLSFEGEPRTSQKGTWSFDNSSKRYSINLGSSAISYVVQSFDDGRYCLLIRGDLDSASLKETWFSFPEQYRKEDFDQDANDDAR
jgi:hypothetical protein